MPLLTPTDPQSTEFRQEQVRKRVRELLDETYREVKIRYDLLAQLFVPDAKTQLAFASLPADQVYGALGDDAEKLKSLRGKLRDFLNEAQPGAGDFEPVAYREAFGELPPERKAAPEITTDARNTESATGPATTATPAEERQRGPARQR